MAGQLVLPSEASYDPDSNWVVQPVYAVIHDTVVAVAASFEVPDWAEKIDTIINANSATDGWLVVPDTLDDHGYLGGRYIYLAGQGESGFLPPGSTHVFDLLIIPTANYSDSLEPYTCNESLHLTLAASDTCMSDHVDYQLQFHTLDSEGSVVKLSPGFVRDSSEFESNSYMPGDISIDGSVNIQDMTELICCLFGSCTCTMPPIVYATDVTGDASTNILDMTYLVQYLFNNGPEPKCYGSELGAPAPKITASADLFAEYTNGTTILTLSNEIDLSGLEVHLHGNGSAVPVSLTDANLELVHGNADGLLKLGLLDLQGVQMIQAGETRIVQIPGEHEIVHALGSSLDHRPVGINLSASATPEVPHSFALHQNYPNPFNPTTTISFDSPETVDYTLTVYNTLGQVVKRFVGMAQPGENEVVWDASPNSSGVYFYKLEIGRSSETKKMMLLK
ncbi:T9SS type A sorting domain-containing protein [candidate division GN15 bacterium]|nr:T9SS type A sorting domain-containing protein [candidate division GN15 bacterium]